MANNVPKIVSQVKNIPKGIAKKVVDETSGVLEGAVTQVLSTKDKYNNSQDNGDNIFLGLNVDKSFSEEERDKLRQADLSRLRELESEIEKIRIEKTVRELQEKIMAGETVYLENYPDIPIEQKQVLKAQLEAVRQRMMVEKQSQRPTPEPSTKPSRRFFGFGGSKKHAEDLQRSTETRMPPSG